MTLWEAANRGLNAIGEPAAGRVSKQGTITFVCVCQAACNLLAVFNQFTLERKQPVSVLRSWRIY